MSPYSAGFSQRSRTLTNARFSIHSRDVPADLNLKGVSYLACRHTGEGSQRPCRERGEPPPHSGIVRPSYWTACLSERRRRLFPRWTVGLASRLRHSACVLIVKRVFDECLVQLFLPLHRLSPGETLGMAPENRNSAHRGFDECLFNRHNYDLSADQALGVLSFVSGQRSGFEESPSKHS